jgi:hypothetical protein
MNARDSSEPLLTKTDSGERLWYSAKDFFNSTLSGSGYNLKKSLHLFLIFFKT